jgi:hypothetical protein
MKVAIYAPPSPGCENSATILAAAIGPAIAARGGSILHMRFPVTAGSAELAAHETAGLDIDCAFFMERMIDHPALLRARHRILLPNPEWLDERTIRQGQRCTQVWHKSRFSRETVAPLFPAASHMFIGFTSRNPERMVDGHDSFVHLRGKLHTHRNTDSIFAAWKAAPHWPDLHAHFYWQRDGGLDYPGWLHDGNVHVKMGWLARDPYLALAAEHGIHLCTSEVEGFGHYINEARAMGALILVVDGAPMNELIDADSGILIRPASTTPMNRGIRHHVSAEDIADAVERVLTLNKDQRRALGAAARQRYLTEGRAFVIGVREKITALADGD